MSSFILLPDKEEFTSLNHLLHFLHKEDKPNQKSKTKKASSNPSSEVLKSQIYLVKWLRSRMWDAEIWKWVFPR